MILEADIPSLSPPFVWMEGKLLLWMEMHFCTFVFVSKLIFCALVFALSHDWLFGSISLGGSLSGHFTCDCVGCAAMVLAQYSK